MKALFDLDAINKIEASKIMFECKGCSCHFKVRRVEVRYALGLLPTSEKRRPKLEYCSRACVKEASKRRIHTTCAQCHKAVEKIASHVSANKNYFCSQSCGAKYNNAHKTTGTRRSKLEVWLESKLSSLFPDLEVKYCDKDTIKSELDIYFPTLKLGVELNGIYHYEPIHGQNKLDQVQNNDARKFQACLEHDIELIIVDSSSLRYFKEQNCLPYLKIIQDIVTAKMLRLSNS